MTRQTVIAMLSAAEVVSPLFENTLLRAADRSGGERPAFLEDVQADENAENGTELIPDYPSRSTVQLLSSLPECWLDGLASTYQRDAGAACGWQGVEVAVSMARSADALDQPTDRRRKSPIQTLMFPDPHRRWDNTRPFVLSVGGHVLVLALLYVSFMHQPRPAAGQRASVVEATLVSAPLQAEIEHANSPSQPPSQPQQAPPQPEPPSVTPQAPSLKQADASPEAARPAAKQVAEQHEPQQSDTDIKQAQVDASVQPAQDGENSPSLAPQQPDASDPYAEMRRQRAEAEHQHQLEEQAILRNASAGVQHAAVAPAAPQADNRPGDPLLVDPPPAAMPFDFSGAWTSGNDPQSMRCPAREFQRATGESISLDWIDCLLDSAVQDPMNRMSLIER